MSEINRESRRKDRKNVEEPVTVVNALSNHKIGQLVNVHEGGFMVIGDGEISENCLYQLAVNLNEPVDGIETISVGAECLWKREFDSGAHYWAGFHIVDLDEEHRKILSTLP